MYVEEKGKTQWAKWWLTAGCFVLTITITFIALTLYLGVGQPPMEEQRRKEESAVEHREGNKAVIEMVSPEEARPISPKFVKIPIRQEGAVPAEEEVFKVATVNRKPLLTHPVHDTLEEMFSGGGNLNHATKKKSEAVFPGWTDPDSLRKPVVVDPENHFKKDPEFRLPGFDPDGSSTVHRVSISQDEPSYYYDEEDDTDEEETIFSYLQNRLKDVYNLVGSGNRKALNSEWIEVLDAVNDSITTKNISSVLTKLKDMYYNESDKDLSVSSIIYPGRSSGVSNATSLVSFGLLAIDLFLLHNVQQIAWSEEKSVADKMLRDPDVLAMNALFLTPEKVRQLRNGHSRYLEGAQPKSVIQELTEFFNGAVRAVTNLSKAYKTSTEDVKPRNSEPTPLDCLWTLYCRNLDKTAKLNGPYGFLAKMNSLGLRLMMGEFPVERAVEKLVTEVTRGWSSIDCPKLFPRCSAEEAKEIVMKTALGENSV